MALRAAQKLGWNHIPCIVEEDLPEDIIKERVIKDNAHFGTWDYDLLANEFEFDVLIDVGFNEKELLGKDEFKNIEDLNTDEEKKKKKKKLKMCPQCGHEF